ncbi:Thiol-disulfide isomerase or thioredoxin [Nitrosomonas sp. Nm51]|uniref:TlpA family protein disulfide reductase n=1 Tax=Nitrosomonas sp. Nm51 TaxID=133720 RepID=UPI0008B41EE1|nr:TlpA disulfide reductase family protein [Nitrosomonas sp. Nm51]SEQ83036.1 Thiol-disulfide isomerase or thioredoxin [Nitrosomonas sp. Nm51]
MNFNGLFRLISKQKLRFSTGILLLVITVGAQAFRFQDTDGKIHTLADYKGRWVIVNFWATWCPPCLEEIPDLIALYESRDDVMVIGVAMEFTDPDVVTAFAQSMSITYPTVLGNRRIASQLDEISLLPSTYFFDPEGKPAARQQGIVTRESIEAFISTR